MTTRTNTKSFNKFLFGTAIASIAMSSPAQADPWSSFTDQHGSISIDTGVANHTQITQTGGLYIGTSTNLDIGAAQSVTINQNSKSALFVGKADNGVNPTRILGALNTRLTSNGSKAGGSVAIFDTNGVVFGPNSMIDTGGVMASTGELDNDRLINDGIMEISNFGTGSIINNGTITISNGGLAAFVAPTVVNNGVITAKAGRVQLGATNTVTTVDLYGDGLLEIAVDEDNEDTLRSINRGEISARGGVVQMTAGAAKNVVDSIVNMEGVVTAKSAQQVGGKIILGGASTGRVIVRGKAEARGVETGGEIIAEAKEINLFDTADLNARANKNGNGGTITLNASDSMILNGQLKAQGGNDSGNGGTIFTSAANSLRIREDLKVNATASNGEHGSWFIDPVDFSIDAVVAGVFQTTLDSGMDISAAATNDITIDALMAWSGNGALALDAGNDVIFNSNVNGNGDFTVDAGRNIDLAAGQFVKITDGNVDFNAGSDVFLRTGSEIDVTNGNIELAAANANGGQSAIEIDGTLTSDNGDITLEATNYFVEINSAANVVQSNGTFTAISDTGFDIDAGATLDLGTANVDVQAPDVRLGADINTTGDITGTATTVAVENTTAQIQDGVDVSAATGGRVDIAAGTFNESVEVTKALVISGAGSDNTIIQPGAGQDGFLIDSDLGDGQVYIRNLAVEGGRNGVNFTNNATLGRLLVGGSRFDNNSSNGVRIGGAYSDVNLNDFEIFHSSFKNNGSADTAIRGDGDIVAFYYNGDARIDNVTIQNDGAAAGIEGDYGIQFRGRGDGTIFPPVNGAAMGTTEISNVTIAGDYRSALLGIQGYTDSSALSLNNVKLGGTTDTGTDSQAWGALYLSSIGSNDIDLGNTVFNAIDGQYIILAACAGYSTANNIDATGVTFEGITGATATLDQQFDIEDKVFHAIDLSGQGLVNWNPGNLYATTSANAFGEGAIQRAVDNSDVGGNIFVKEGTYNESVTINKNALSLFGAKAGTSGTAFSRLFGLNESVVTGDSPAFIVDGQFVTIDGFTMDGADLTYGVYIDDKHSTTIVNNIVKNSSEAAIGGVLATNSKKVRTTLIDNNKFDHTNTGDGIDLSGDNGNRAGGDAILATNVVITNNQIGSFFRGGVDGNGIKLSSIGDIDGALAADGVAITETTVLIEGNNIIAGDDGVDFDGTVRGDVTINDNIIFSDDEGVQFEDTIKKSTIVISDNNIRSEDDGIALYGALRNSSLSITDNQSIIGEEDGIDLARIKNSDVAISGNGLIQGEDENGVEFDGNVINSAVSVDNNLLINGGENGIAVEGDVSGEEAFVVASNNILAGENGILFSGDLSNDSGGDKDIEIVDNSILGFDSGIAFTGEMSGRGHTTKIKENQVIAGVNNGISHTGSIIDNAKFKVNKNEAIGGGNNGILVRADITGDGFVKIKENGVGAISGDSIKIVNTAETAPEFENELQVQDFMVRGSTGSKVEVIDNDIVFSGNNGVKVSNVETVTIQENTISNSGHDGIQVSNSAFVDVSETNTVNNSGRNGVKVDRSQDVSIQGNIIDGSDRNGIKVTNGTFVDISNANTVTDSGRNGIVVKNDGVPFIDPRPVMVKGYEYGPVGSVNIADNVVTGSGTNGIKSVGADNVTIDTNTVTDSARNGIVTKGTGLVSSSAIPVTAAAISAMPVSTGMNITGNIVSNSGTNGIKATDASEAGISGNMVETSGDSALLAERMPDVTISQNILTTSANGIEVDGEIDQVALITGNTLTDNETGMLLRGGLINFTDIANPNTISGGVTAMKLAPDSGESDSLGLVANTFGNTILEGMTGNYFELSNGALFNPGTPTIIDAFGVSFDGYVPLNNQIAPGIIAGEDRDRLEGRIIDFDDNFSTGDIFVGVDDLDLNGDDLFALNLFSLQPNPGIVNVTFNGLPFTSAAALGRLSPAAGAADVASALNNITPAAGGTDEVSAFDLANLEPAAGAEEGCWASAGETQFSGPVSFSFGGDVTSNLSGQGCD